MCARVSARKAVKHARVVCVLSKVYLKSQWPCVRMHMNPEILKLPKVRAIGLRFLAHF